MNITFLSFFNGLSDRGSETFVHELASRLSKNFQVTVYQNGRANQKASYTIKYLPSLQSLPDFDPQPDIIIPTNGRLQAILTRVWAYAHHAKVIISGQSGLGFDDRVNLFTFPNVFVGLTDYQCGWAKKANPLIRIEKIPNGVDLIRFNSDVPPLKVNLPHPIVLYVAALEQIKRHNLLIEAMAKSTASLMLVGQGSLEKSITDQAKNALGLEKFKILSLPYSQIPSVYTACDLFVYPTAPWESFGMTMIEALASGLPVVATSDPIRKEIVGDAGILSDPTDTIQFAQAINQTLKKKWRNLPRKQAEKFSWDNIAGVYTKLCNSL